jgi:hypothetical protein
LSRAPCRTLAEYVGELVRRLGQADPDALARMQAVVGSRRARIRLDDEAVDVAFGAGGGLQVTEPAGDVDGEGATDRGTVLDLLDAHLEVTDALLDGRLRVTGAVDDIARMFTAIEILLDVSARAPALQRLARDFHDDPCREPAGPPGTRSRATAWHPTGPDADELALLARLDLLAPT